MQVTGNLYGLAPCNVFVTHDSDQQEEMACAAHLRAWSWMRETSGEMHTVTPPHRMAGSWYTRLLPAAPQGMLCLDSGVPACKSLECMGELVSKHAFGSLCMTGILQGPALV